MVALTVELREKVKAAMAKKGKTAQGESIQPKGEGAVLRPLLGECQLEGFDTGKNMGGRPTLYNDDTRELILALLMEGQTLTRICKTPGMPKYSTVCEWLSSNPTFSENYARARAVQSDYFADETIDISDTEPDPQVARVRIDARKWHASKTAPKKYGDRPSEGADDIAPPPTTVTIEVRDARKSVE